MPQAPAHDPDLLVQARTALGAVSGTGALGDRVRFENVAAAMALQAHHDGLQQIDQVVTGPVPGRVFAVQGQDPAAPESRHAAIDLAQAAARPARESLRDLQQALQPAPAPVLAQQDHVQGPAQDPPPQGQGVAQDPPPQAHGKPYTV